MADNAVALNDTRESCSLQFAVTFLAPRIAIMMHAFDAPSRAEKMYETLERRDKRWRNTEGGRREARQGETRGGWLACLFVVPFALSFAFIRLSFPPVQLCFMATGAATQEEPSPARKGWLARGLKGGQGGRGTA